MFFAPYKLFLFYKGGNHKSPPPVQIYFSVMNKPNPIQDYSIPPSTEESRARPAHRAWCAVSLHSRAAELSPPLLRHRSR
jgi:hypothetical protein